MVTDCLFCQIISGDIPSEPVRSTEHTYAFRDIAPQALFHILIVPRVHYVDAVALAQADPELLAELVKDAAAIADEKDIADSGYRLVWNTGRDAGQTVFHAHLHLLGGGPLGGMVGGPGPLT